MSSGPKRHLMGMRAALAISLLAAVSTPGCTLWRGQVDPATPQAEPPSAGIEFGIGEVRDLREFQLGVGTAWEPRLYEGDPEDDALTDRVVGRRRRISQPRNDSRPRLGNLLLPEGRSVQQLVSEAVVTGFRRAGFRAWPAGGGSEIAPIDIEIRGFWSRSLTTIGIIRFETWIQLHLRAPGTPYEDGAPLCSVSLVTATGESAAIWRQAIESALEDLAERLEKGLRDGPTGLCVSP